jgi:hypothetical protein
MYLSAKKYIPGWPHSKDDERKSFYTMLAASGLLLKDIAEDSPCGYIQVNIGYWRKANAIHNWFVQKVQNSKDECQTSYVSRDTLAALLSEVELVLLNKGEAGQRLPPASGFFFGSTEINEWYWDDMNRTRDMLQAILSNPRLDGWDFAYHASW